MNNRIPSTHWRAGLALVLALVIAAPAAYAKRAPQRDADASALVSRGAPEARVEALRGGRVEDGVQRQYGMDSNLLRRYWLRDLNAQPTSTASPREIASNWVKAHASELGLTAAAVDQNLEFAYGKESPSGTHFRWNQVLNGVPVYRSEIVVKVNKRGQVSSVMNNLQPSVSVATSPSITDKQALEKAVATVQPGRAIGAFKADLAIVMQDRTPRLAYIASLPVEKPSGDWRVFVDAKTGDVIGVADEMRYATGTGRAFDPDPRSKMGDSTYMDNADANTAVPFPASYDNVTLQGITFTGSVYTLDGPYARLIDNEAPTQAPVTPAHQDSFRFQRSDQGFEDVMCYWHLDYSQRYIQSLGFTNVNNRVQQVDSHGLSGADNSHYVPSTGNLAFGEGGIDDDEDADVIWHEYGHSIQDNIVPGWGGGQEGAMGEGFGDYWGGSYSLFKFPGFQPMHFFTWDGNGETWTGRPLIDVALHYPEDCCGEVHDSGTLWCSGLIDTWNSVGRTVMDRIVLDHHFALGTSATMADAANQIIQSDIDLYGGAHVGTIVSKFGFWGFVNPADFIPTITHTPLVDVENVTGPYAVVATVTSVQPLAGSPMLFWGHGASISDSVAMAPTANPNEYSANIPGPGVASNVVYYIRARDTNGGTAYKPTTAPATPYVFHVGADVTPPTIVHTPITIAPVISWPLTVAANVTDNLGVNTTSVTVTWTLNAVAQSPFTLARVGVTNNYSATFPAVAVVPGDVVTYHITAQDIATVPNSGRSPAVGENTFTLTSALGTVLVLDDDELAKRTETKVIVDEKDPTKSTSITATNDVSIQSANTIAAWLNAMGYVATVEPAATSNPTTWTGYSFIVSASGQSLGPVANATYRAAVEAYVAGGGKILVEGGEVGYDAISTPGYPTFAANVLHGTTWNTDNAGALTRAASQGGHPLANIPNALPASIPVTYVSPNYGMEDAYTPVAPAYIVYGTANYPASVGISVFDNNAAPQSAQIVVFAFDLKQVTDSTTAKQLLENAAHFLVAPEPPPTSNISGRVAVGTAWGGAGITVTLQPGNLTTTTNAAGEFAFPPQYAQTYQLSAALAGYSGTPRMVTALDNSSYSVVLSLFGTAESNSCNNPALAIPDNTPAGVTNDMTVVPNFAVSYMELGVNITHTWRGDLIVELRHGATNVRVHNRTGSSADNIIGTYPTTLTPANPLSAFFGQSSAGTWTMFVSDNAGTDTGTLNQWCLLLRGAADTTQTVGVGPSNGPQAFEFAPVWPNPSRGGNMTMSFALPSASHGRLALYDVTGRLVRVVADREFEAGRYVMAFDGRDSHGATLRPGLYLARFTGDGRTVSRRFVVTQ